MFRGRVRLTYLRGRDRDSVTKIVVVVAPAGKVFIEKLTERRRRPRHRVHAVGDGGDGVTREHAARHLAMLHRHSVHVTGEAKREEGHIKRAVAIATSLAQQL